MSNLRIALVEDEIIIAETIGLMLEELGYTVCWHAVRYGEAVNLLDQDLPDLLLLDIQIAGKLDGIDLAKLVQEQYNLPYIFITANADAGTIERAKTVKPLAYLTKPVTKSLLFSAIEIAVNNYNHLTTNTATPEKPAITHRESIFVKDSHGYRKISFNAIIYLQSDANYVHLKLMDGKQVLVRSTLPELLEQLDPAQFLRVQRSYAVNMLHVERVGSDEVIVGGETLPLGKTYKPDLMAALGISE